MKASEPWINLPFLTSVNKALERLALLFAQLLYLPLRKEHGTVYVVNHFPTERIQPLSLGGGYRGSIMSQAMISWIATAPHSAAISAISSCASKISSSVRSYHRRNCSRRLPSQVVRDQSISRSSCSVMESSGLQS